MLVKDEVASTNDLAKALAIEGEPEGTVVTAKTPERRKGPNGPQLGIAGGRPLSLRDPAAEASGLGPDPADGAILPAGGADHRGGVPRRPAHQVAERRRARRARRWPEYWWRPATTGGEPRFLVLGIGVNLNTEPGDLTSPEAGSLKHICGKELDPEHFLNLLLFKLDDFYAKFKRGERDLALYERYSESLGQDLEIELGDQKVKGKGMYLEADGSLVLRSEDGMIYRLTSVHDVVPLDRGQVRFETGNVH